MLLRKPNWQRKNYKMAHERKKSVSATYKQKKAIDEALNTYLHPIENTDMYRYEDGWNDERIAKSIDESLNKNHVLPLRLEIYGKMQRTEYGKNQYSMGGQVSNRLMKIEKQLRRLIQYCGCNAQEEAEILGNVESNDGT